MVKEWVSNKNCPDSGDSFGFFQGTKIHLISRNKRPLHVDFNHLTDEKHIWIYINYNGKFGESPYV